MTDILVDRGKNLEWYTMPEDYIELPANGVLAFKRLYLSSPLYAKATRKRLAAKVKKDEKSI